MQDYGLPSRQEGHFGLFEGTMLVVTALTAKLLLPFPSLMARLAGPAGWLLVAGMLIWATLGALAMTSLLRRFPRQSLPEVITTVAGNWLGLLLNLTLVIWLVADGALVLRLFTETFIVAILPRTPPSVLSLLALLVAVYAGYLGVEAIARTNLVLWPLMGIAFLTILVFSLPQARADWLFPLLGPGPGPLVSHSLRYAGAMSEVALLGIYGYAMRGTGQLRRAALSGLWLAGVALALTVAIYTGIDGAAGAAQHPFPFFGLARLVYLGRFFQRMESLFVVLWILGALIRLSIFLHAAAVTTATTLRLPYYRPLLFPLAVLLFSLSLVPSDFVTAMLWEHMLESAESIPAFVLPAILLAAAAVRRPEEAHPHG